MDWRPFQGDKSLLLKDQHEVYNDIMAEWSQKDAS